MTVFRIALRYLIAPKSHRAVNVISTVAMAGVAVATMAIVVVLSVFNGFSDLARSHWSKIDPEVLIKPANGAKVIYCADSLANALAQRPDIAEATAVLSERALIVSNDGNQMPVIAKGIDHDRQAVVTDIADMIIDGTYSSESNIYDNSVAMQAAVGVAINMSMRPSPYSMAKLYVPRRLGRINPANPAAAYRQLPVMLTGVFQVDQPEYDADHILLPIEHFRQLLEYPAGTGSAIELKAAQGVKIQSLIHNLRHQLTDYEILGRDEQQADALRMISVEKWITFLMLVFILLIAAFNIVSTLSLIVIEKRDDMTTLRALGAPMTMVRSIFVALGWLITTIGGCIGIVLGLILALTQQHFGIIRLNADPTALSIDVYPVIVDAVDIVYVFAAIVATGLIIGFISRIFTKNAD